MSNTNDQKTQLPKVVIIGAGFGGLAAAKALANKPVNVTVIDKENHHLFQPLLYQVATATLSPAHIAQPIRSLLSAAKNTDVVMADVTGFDVAKKLVVTKDRSYSYDYLIVATGARHSYFGNPQWEEFAPGLKSLDDALNLRHRILGAFEKAEATQDPKERERLLTFVIVGAGPTGVEMAGAISDIARLAMKEDYRHLDPQKVKVILLDAADRVLPPFHPSLSEKAKVQLEELQVDVRLSVGVKEVNAKGVQAGDEFIEAETVIWAAGNSASPLVKSLPGEVDRAGRIVVTHSLHLPDHKNIYVIGDTANCPGPEGRPLPGVCTVALQQGKHAAYNVLSMVNGDPPSEFSYWDRGSMATIGRNRAVADVHVVRFSGFFAWVSWVMVHVFFLMSFRKQLSVMLTWIWSYFTKHNGARLIINPTKKD